MVHEKPPFAFAHAMASDPLQCFGRPWRKFAEQFFTLLKHSAQAAVVRIDVKRGAERLAGGCQLADVQLAKPHSLPRAEMAGIQGDDLFAVGDGLFVLSTLPVTNCATGHDIADARIFPDGL